MELNSARVKVSLQDKEKFLDVTFWPENVRVRSWIFVLSWTRQGPVQPHWDG